METNEGDVEKQTHPKNMVTERVLIPKETYFKEIFQISTNKSDDS